MPQPKAAKKPAAKKQDAKKQDAKKTDSEAEEQSEELTPYQPRHSPLQSVGFDQHAAEEARQADLQDERDEHNRRTGDVSR